MTEVGPSVLRRAREREHREVYTKTEKSKETRYKILLENQNFLLNSVSENFVPSEQEFATSHTTHNSKSEKFYTSSTPTVVLI